MQQFSSQAAPWHQLAALQMVVVQASLARLLGPNGNSSQIPFDCRSSMLGRVKLSDPTCDFVVPLLLLSSSMLWEVWGFLGFSHSHPSFQNLLVCLGVGTCAVSTPLCPLVHRLLSLRAVQPLSCFHVLRLFANACILLRLPLLFVCAIGLVHCMSTLSFFRVTKSRIVVGREVVCWEIFSSWPSPSFGHSRFCFRKTLVNLTFPFVLLVRRESNTVMEVEVMVIDSSVEALQGFWSWQSELVPLLPFCEQVEAWE